MQFLPASTGQEVFQMKQVASTDQKGHLIILAGKAIDITGEGQRDAETLQALIDHLQAFKEGKPYPPPSAPALSCCGYPHYDDPKRPNFGQNQVRYLCQLYPGLRIRSYSTKYNPNGTLGKVISYPYQQKGYWMVKIEDIKGICEGVVRAYSLDDNNVTGRPRFGEPRNWLGFEDLPTPTHCHH